ncbi:MAG: hypothetical protein ACLFPQ_01865 [Candidatus Woesearchaeota archaeon]
MTYTNIFNRYNPDSRKIRRELKRQQRKEKKRCRKEQRQLEYVAQCIEENNKWKEQFKKSEEEVINTIKGWYHEIGYRENSYISAENRISLESQVQEDIFDLEKRLKDNTEIACQRLEQNNKDLVRKLGEYR